MEPAFMSKLKIPCCFWLENYKKAFLKYDILAGIIVAVMLIPQSMAYARIAGLPPVAGIYASTIPLFIYALFGSSRHLVVGPVAILSLLVLAACSEYADPGTREYLRIVVLLTLLVGILQVMLCFLRAGFLINFVSNAVMSGFISAAAIIIMLTQAGHLLGLDLAAGYSAITLVGGVFGEAGEVHLPTAAVGIGTAGLLYIAKKQWPHAPAALIAVILAILLVKGLNLDALGVAIVGEVPGGLPQFSVPLLDAGMAVRLFPAALIIVFVGYVESMGIAQWAAMREKDRIYPNLELGGLGAANVFSGLFSGYVVAGGFSRTAVNYKAGARTPLASVVAAVLVLAVLLFLTPLFYYLPDAVLAAIIFVSIAGLVDYKYALLLFRIKKADGWTLLITFFVTLLVGIEQGILTGIVFSLTLFVARSSRPRTAVLGYVKRENAYRDIRLYPEAQTDPHMIIMRVDASLYFANARYVQERAAEQLAQRPDTKWVILDMSGVNDIDAVALSTLGSIKENFAHHGVTLVFAGMKAQVREVIEKADWHDSTPRQKDFPTLQQAVRRLESKQHTQDEQNG